MSSTNSLIGYVGTQHRRKRDLNNHTNTLLAYIMEEKRSDTIGSNFLKLKKPGAVLLRSKISRIRSDCKKLAESWTGAGFEVASTQCSPFITDDCWHFIDRDIITASEMLGTWLRIFPYITMNGIINNFSYRHAIRSRLVPCTWRNVCVRTRHRRIEISQLDFSSFYNVISQFESRSQLTNNGHPVEKRKYVENVFETKSRVLYELTTCSHILGSCPK